MPSPPRNIRVCSLLSYVKVANAVFQSAINNAKFAQLQKHFCQRWSTMWGNFGRKSCCNWGKFAQNNSICIVWYVEHWCVWTAPVIKVLRRDDRKIPQVWYLTTLWKTFELWEWSIFIGRLNKLTWRREISNQRNLEMGVYFFVIFHR